MELEPRDRGRRKTAGSRDADQLRELVRDRVSLERPDDARRDDEDRRDGGERELEAGVEERVRVPAEKHRGADDQRLPAVALTSREPGKRAQAGGECRAHHGWMNPDGESVGGHREQGGGLCDIDPEAEKEGDSRDAAPNGSDFQPVHGEAVVETRRSEVVEQPLIDAEGAAEHDRLDHIASLALQAERRVAAEPAADAVADAGDTATAPDDPPRLSTQDRMDPLPA